MQKQVLRKILVFIASLIIAVLNTWPYDYLWSGDWNKIHYAALNRHAENLFEKPGEETPHEYRMKYRLAAPLVAKLSPHAGAYGRMRFMMVIMGALGLVFWYLFYQFLSRNFPDENSRDALMLMLGLTHFPHAFFGDITGVFDAFGYFGLLLAFLSPSGLIRFLALSLACWTDERSVMAAGLILLCDWVRLSEGKNLFSFLKSARNFSIYAAILLYLPLRFYLQLVVFQDGFSAGPQAGWEMLAYNFKRMPLTYFTFAGLWGMVGLASLQGWRLGKKIQTLLLTASGIVLCFSAFLVIDITRSQAYFFPWVLCSLLILSAHPFEGLGKKQPFWITLFFVASFFIALLGKAI